MQKLDDARVAVCSIGCGQYAGADEAVWQALCRAGNALGWNEKDHGPIARVIPPGARVLLKPNLVSHSNQAPYGVDPLLTHRSIIAAAYNAAKLAGASEICVGDAPIQTCDFDLLLKASGLDEWSSATRKANPHFTHICDFRRTVAEIRNGVMRASEEVVAEDQFVLFDLRNKSMLEPVTDASESFRVTCYDPALLQKTHAPGRHCYLVAREVLDSDVVINLPKLKMHKKAGITCALKNLVGINGNKEFLPHHRVGGSSRRGDCYPGASRIKEALEYVFDRQNSTKSTAAAHLWRCGGRILQGVLKVSGDRLGLEGSWSGNDTVWRMCLDLNRILLYGKPDGTLADRPHRRVISFVDAVIAGQGNGPLAPEPLPLGLVLLGESAAAVDWVGAQLLGYEPAKIPLVRNAFHVDPFPLATFKAGDVQVTGDFSCCSSEDLNAVIRPVPATHYPSGWTDAVRGFTPEQTQPFASEDQLQHTSRRWSTERLPRSGTLRVR